MSYLTGLLERQTSRSKSRYPSYHDPAMEPFTAGAAQQPFNQEAFDNPGTLTDARRFPATSGAPVPGSRWNEDWWENPNVGFGQNTYEGQPVWVAYARGPQGGYAGGGITRNATVPDWASGEFDDPRVFYDFWSRMTPEEQARYQAAASAGHVARTRTEQASARGISELRGAHTRLGGRQEEFLSDPRWQTIFDTLEGYASGESPMISPEELTLARLGLSQRYAQSDAAVRGSAAGRGVGTSGNIGQLLDPMKVYTDVGGLQLAAQARAENRAGELRATVDLARMLGSREGVTLAYETELDRLTGAIAAIEAGKEYEPTDLPAFDQLTFSMNAYNDAMDYAESMEARYEEESKFGGWDLAEFALRIAGGFPGLTAGLFS